MEYSRHQLTYKEALSKATELCSRGEKCSFDIEMKCREWQLSKEDTAKVISYLIEEKFIDNQRYAISYVNDKFRFNKWGKIKLAYTLRQKQVEETFIREALSNLQEDVYLKVLANLLSAKAKSVKDINPYARRGKLLAFAQSRGFEADAALRIIETIC